MSYQYRAVQLPQNIQVTPQNRDTAAASLIEKVINNYAESGWEFYRIDTVNTVEPPGCLAGLFGAPSTHRPLNVVIFRKPA